MRQNIPKRSENPASLFFGEPRLTAVRDAINQKTTLNSDESCSSRSIKSYIAGLSPQIGVILCGDEFDAYLKLPSEYHQKSSRIIAKMDSNETKSLQTYKENIFGALEICQGVQDCGKKVLVLGGLTTFFLNNNSSKLITNVGQLAKKFSDFKNLLISICDIAGPNTTIIVLGVQPCIEPSLTKLAERISMDLFTYLLVTQECKWVQVRNRVHLFNAAKAINAVVEMHCEHMNHGAKKRMV